MARPRLTQMRAEISGADKKDPQRFRDRKGPAKVRPVGDPYAAMTPAQVVVWEECRANMPWLNSGHRLLLRQVCILSAMMDDPDVKPSTLQCLGVALSKIGATPTDETKVKHSPGDDDDPSDQYFARSN